MDADLVVIGAGALGLSTALLTALLLVAILTWLAETVGLAGLA